MLGIPVGFDFMVAVRCIAALGAIAVLYWLADAIGDQREAKVWASINAAIEKTNSDIDKQLSIDERIAQVAERARAKALSAALAQTATSIRCPASKLEAESLTAIK